MCGFAVLIRLDGGVPSPDALDRMSASMVHRGPDDEGRFIHRNVGLVFRRLSILDVTSAGHQPMHSPTGRYTIVFNGEIFNYIELRDQLVKKGYLFKSGSDTEVLLNAYIEWKEQCLEKLNGMWAFIVYDKESGTFFCARDRFGIKPIYYYRSESLLIFASETSVIRESALCDLKPDAITISRYLYRDELDTTDDTFYADIKSVTPGSYLYIEPDGRIRHERYWQLPETSSQTVDYVSIADTFADSVRIRLRSDVPVGVFLSGGLDSTSILCAAARQLKNAHGIRAYSYMDEEFDESRYINATVAQTGATLVPLQVDSGELWQHLLAMLRNHDAPVHTPSALIGYCLFQAAKRDGVKVILNGQGADETFGGYPRYFDNYWYTLVKDHKFKQLLTALSAYGEYHRIAMIAMIKRVMLKFLREQLNRIRLYRKFAAAHHKRALRRGDFYSADLVDALPDGSKQYKAQDLGSVLARAVEVSPLPLYLRIEDRNSMSSSVEARVPFMDHRLVTAVMGMLPTMKIDRVLTKMALRIAMQGSIPETIRTRVDKMGFPTPDAQWVRQWGREIHDIFSSASFRQRGVFNVPRLNAALHAHIDGSHDYHWEIFKALQLELWFRSAIGDH